MNTLDRLVLYGGTVALVVIAIRLRPLSAVGDAADEATAWTRLLSRSRQGVEQVFDGFSRILGGS